MADTEPEPHTPAVSDSPGSAVSDSPGSAVIDPGSRGTLTVLDRAVERIAGASLTRTDGVVTSGGGFGRKASRVTVTKQDDRVRAAADVTVDWPRPAARVAHALREDVARGMTDSGLRADSVDVHVSDFGAVSAPTGAGSAGTLVPATRPLATPAATPLAIIVSLVLLAGAGVLVRDALVGLGALTGTAWTASAIDWIDGLTPQSWMFPGGIAVAVVGALVVLASLKWRARRYRASGVADDVWVHKADLKKLAEPDAITDPEPSVDTSEVSR